MADANPYTLLADDEPSAAEHTSALVAALRRQQAAAQVQRDFSGLMGAIGSSGATAYGASLASSADAQDSQAHMAGQQLMQALQGRQRAAQEAAELQRQGTRDAESARHNRAMEGSDNYTFFTGGDGLVRKGERKSGRVDVIGAGPPRGAGGGTGESMGFTPDLLDHYAQELNAGKGYPKSASGKAGQRLAAAIEKRAYELDPSRSATSAASDFGADKKSLDHLQHQSDAVMSFVKTFDKNVSMLEDAAGKLHSSNSPFLNKGLRWYQSNVEGDPNVTAFKNALSAVTSEMGKINSGSTGAGGVPISVLQEMEHNLPASATPAQVAAALKIARQDSENRRAAMEEQIGEIRSRRDSHGTAPKAPPAASTAGAAGAAGPHAGKVKVSNGKETLWVDPADVADAEHDGFKRG